MSIPGANSTLQNELVAPLGEAAANSMLQNELGTPPGEAADTAPPGEAAGKHVRWCDPVRCHLCGKKFAFKTYLKTHIKNVHQGRKDYKCSQCGKCFTQGGDLKVHIESVHEGKRHKCTHCDKLYSQRSAMLQHVRVEHPDTGEFGKHKKPKPRCDLCGKTFSRPHGVTLHKAAAHGIRNPGATLPQTRKCQYCDYTTTKTHNFKRHVARKHTGAGAGAGAGANASAGAGVGVPQLQLQHGRQQQPQQRGKGTKRQSLGGRQSASSEPEQFRSQKSLRVTSVEL